MSKITYISPLTISGINAITELSNSESQLKYLPPIDFYFLLFSVLYQSGTDFFQLDLNQLPSSITTDPFWKKKFVQTDDRAYKRETDSSQ